MSQAAAAFTAFFTMIFTLFRAGDNFATSIENLSVVTRDASGEYADEATYNRNKRAEERKAKRQAEPVPQLS